MTFKDPLILERIRKLEELKTLNIDPYYKNRFEISHNSVQAIELAEKGVREIADIHTNSSKNISTAGRIVLFRSMGKLIFATIQDQAGRLQICFQKDFFTVEGLDESQKTPLKFVEKLLDLGDFIGVSGEMFKTNHGELTLFVNKLTFLSKALRPMPEKFHGLSDTETCYRERNLDLMTNQETMDRFILRSKMVQEIRGFFAEKQFLEVETSILQGQAGGAMAKVFETHHNALDHDFVLRIALELDLKRAIGGGLERIFEIGKNFRNEGTDPSHLQEFSMLEWYAAYCSIEDNKAWTEELFHRLCKNVFKKNIITVRDTEGNETEIDFGKKFDEKRFPDLIKEYTGLDMLSASMEEIQTVAKNLGIDYQGVGKGNLLDDIYKKTARPNLIQPTFVFDYPEELKPLAAPKGDGTANCFQLVVNSWEIVNSYGELIDPLVQRRLLEEQSDAKAGGDDEAMEVDEVFLKAMEHGFPPMTGSGFGIDRLAAIFTGQPNLRDVVLFPTMKPEKKEVSAKEAEAKYRAKKIVVIADEFHPDGLGAIANAIGQLGIEIGGHSKEQLFEAKILHDSDNKVHYADCFYGMSNLRGSQSQMAEFVKKCHDASIQVFDFSDIMRKAHTDKQMQDGYKAKKTDEIGYMAVGALIPADFEKEFLEGLDLFGAK